MQLDQTHVTVRIRKLSEIGDLSLVLLHRYPSILLVGFFVGALPWMILNAILLYWIPITEAQYGLDDSEAFNELARYATWMSLLVFLQTPSAGVLTTIYLGQAVFEKAPSWKSAIQIARKQFWRWFYCLSVKRLAVPAMLVCALRITQPMDSFFDIAIPIVVFFVAIIVRASRPYLPEMILLEMCPIRSKNAQVITLSRRAKALHRPVGGDVGGRWLTVAFMLLVLFAGWFYSLVWARGVTTGYWNIGLTTLLALFPLALWTVAGLSVVVRMIAYLDTRIRLEGWDVELAVRAEAMRQFGIDPVHDSGPKSAAIGMAESEAPIPPATVSVGGEP